jgi:hypothetical protein
MNFESNSNILRVVISIFLRQYSFDITFNFIFCMYLGFKPVFDFPHPAVITLYPIKSEPDSDEILAAVISCVTGVCN